MRLSRISYFADFVITAAIVAWLTTRQIETHRSAMQIFLWLYGAIAGVFAWTLIEYAVHRVLFHRVAYFERLHHAHHSRPADYLGAPPGVGPLALVALSAIPAREIGGSMANGLTCGMLAGYLIYMLIHHAVHHWTGATTAWLYGARRHHALHHYHSDDGNFGVSTALWDHAFGTSLEPSGKTRARAGQGGGDDLSGA